MHRVSLAEETEKICPLTQQLTWLGIHFYSTDTTMSIPQEKLNTIVAALWTWSGKLTAIHREIQSL